MRCCNYVGSSRQWRIHSGTGDMSQHISGRALGDSHAKVTHSDAIAGFTSQSLGLPTYACKTGSSTAIKLAHRMHQNLPFWAQKSKKISGERHSPILRPLSRNGGGRPSPIRPTFSAPSAPRSSHSPWFVPHFLNCGYAGDRGTIEREQATCTTACKEAI